MAATELVRNQINQRPVDAATRDLARAAKEETNWLVLLRQFEALGSLNTQAARDEELDVLTRVADRMAQIDGPSDLIHAVFPAVIAIRDRMLDPTIPPATLMAMGKKTAPVLGEVLEVAKAHFDIAQQGEESRETYGKLVAAIDQTITRIDKIVVPPEQRPPQAKLRESWEKKDKAGFTKDVETWQARFETPAYQSQVRP
jgi:hypothetical protein